MRTDSARISNEALGAVRDYIQEKYGADYVPAKPRVYRSRKSAQEAHEAIRPTSMELSPPAVKKYLTGDEYKLYSLIWNRFVASQMASAIFDTTTVNIDAANYMFRAAGSVTKFPGFLKAYQDRPPSKDNGDEPTANEFQEGSLPKLEEGQVLKLHKLDPQQHFTQPPPRFNEASLVKELEENGIGRPSTYASILATLTNREYVTKEKSRFFPTELGKLVTELLVKSFGDLIDVEYTAKMEEQLDEIEDGKLAWVQALKGFNKKFQADLARAKTEMRNVKTEETPTDQKCSKCDKPMVIKWGRYGKFLACSGYPECRNTSDLADNGNGDKEQQAPQVEAKCENCGKEMVVRKGRYGQFLACSGYPDCKTTRKLQVTESGSVTAVEEKLLDEKCPRCEERLVIKQGRFGPFTACSQYPKCRYIKLKETGVKCPRDGGMIVERKSRRGKAFYGCDKYPDCDFVLWYHPVDRPCPQCGSKVMVEKTTKRDGHVIFCPDKECGFKESDDGAKKTRASGGTKKAKASSRAKKAKASS
jgi:DNA topoisomerase-1